MIMMIKIFDYSNWEEYEGQFAGSGRSEKIWLESPEGEFGLFKYPKIDPQTKQVTSEHVSECLAHLLGDAIGIPTARVDIGMYKERIGCLSYLVNQDQEELIEGIHFVTGCFPRYNSEKLLDEETDTYYCIDHIFTSTRFIPPLFWIQMMIFDFLIGNADRHQNNWALLAKIDTVKKTVRIRNCPLYDNGSSLCYYVNESQIKNYFGKDPGPFNALVDSKSRSMIRIDGSMKTHPRHSDVVKYLLINYPDEAKPFAERIVALLSEERINNILGQFPTNLLSEDKNLLIRKFLMKKVDLLRSIMEAI